MRDSADTAPKPRRRSAPVVALREFIYRHIGIRVRQRKVQIDNRGAEDLDAYLAEHVCLRPFQSLETTNRGHAHVCCPDWLPTPIATLHSDLLVQWAGPVARKIRASVTDGSYRYCSRRHCDDIANRLLPHRDSEEVRATLEAFAAAGDGAPPPIRIGLSHDRSCNLSCPSCRTTLITADKKEQAKLDAFFERALVPLLRVAKNVYVTGTGDPFGSNHFRRALRRLDRQAFGHLAFELRTNGLLFDERSWADLDLAGRIHTVHISIDAARPETYAVVRRGGDFGRLLQNLAFIRDLKQAGQIPILEFSMVVQTRNFREMPAFVRLGEEFSADIVWFDMIRDWGTYSAAEFAEECIGDPAHPRHHEMIEVLHAPELTHEIARAGNVWAYVRGTAPREDAVEG